jgi:signal transduction histidine kinase
MGLFVMQERTALVEGTLTIASEPGRGTEITAMIPRGR